MSGLHMLGICLSAVVFGLSYSMNRPFWGIAGIVGGLVTLVCILGNTNRPRNP